MLSRGDVPPEKHTEAVGDVDFRKFFFRLQYAHQSGTLPLVDETGMEGKVSMQPDADLNDKQVLQAILFREGLKITKSVREIDVLVIKTTEEGTL